ncbi:MAG TPA: GAF domain-containing sensor histidine kinase [Candidatus Dormibacteraeota bacterium]|jgi:signal transduction histidine kinase|nr:GAF domain-containing sensor histidine kinase [Candidatus Dormibacteraeota bacterium]
MARLVDEGAQRERELALLEEAAQFLAAAPRPADIYPVIVRLAALIGATPERRWRASYLALEGDVLRRIAVHDDAEIELGTREYPLHDYPMLRAVVEQREPVFTDMTAPIGMPDEAAAAVRQADLGAGYMVPVAQGGELYGILALTTRFPTAEHHVRHQRLRAVAHLAALAIGNARLLAEEQQVAEQARALELAKSRFLNLAAHEMRGPLGVIRGYTDMLADGTLGPLTEPMAGALATLARKGEEMNRLVTLMVEVARMEDARFELNTADLDLRDVATEVVSVLSPLIGEAHVVTVDAGDIPLRVSGDEDRLVIVITNLLDNAGKYSAPGTPIHVACAAEDGRATVSVTDHGTGLSDDELSVLFTRFGRVVTADNGHIGGVGLGLWLAREIARMHGGDIEVVSTLGEGSTFTLTVPLRA